MKKWIGVAAAIAIGLSSTVAMASDKLKVGFIYIGPPGDFGWTYAHDQGRKLMEKELGGQVETTYVENVPEGPDAERAIERLARDGHGLIFTTSFGYMNPTLKVAQKFPKVDFEHATGYKRAKNVGTYAGRFYQARYVLGQIAGKMSKSGTAGYIGSFPIPEVVQGINAFMLGAQTVNPDFKLKIVWVNSWYDPAKEADAAKVLIDQGADIITQHTDSPAALQVAEQRGVYAFGQDSDMIQFAPKAQLSAIVNNWGPYYVERAKLKLEGKWTPDDTWDGMKEGMVQLAPFTNMPDDVKALAQATADKIKSGEYVVFSGPITKQDGSVAVEAGKSLTDPEILGMNWYVKGIDDKFPQ
ncbi:BMP family ABC transporter substrate-binding protein [Segnochrobactraceae bacterium EtOH-i3]